MDPESGIQNKVGSADEHLTFNRAKDALLSSLSPRDRGLYSPCFSVNSLLASMNKLPVVADRIVPGQNSLRVVHQFTEALKPYFKIVDLLVSSNPLYAAIVWGGLRLVLELASNFTTFFDKFITLMSQLTESLSQYRTILKLCSSFATVATPYDTKSPEFSRIVGRTESVYRDILGVFHAAVRVFTKSNGSFGLTRDLSGLKKTPMVIADLLWRPFDTRFGELLNSIKSHREAIFEDIFIHDSKANTDERVRADNERRLAAKERELSVAEREEVMRERELCQAERTLTKTERQQSLQARLKIDLLLKEHREAVQGFERERIERVYQHLEKWLSPPRFLDAKEKATQVRFGNTASWIFKESMYQYWRHRRLPVVADLLSFGSSSMWIYANPGAGKTVLAASIIDRLTCETSFDKPSEVYYYFFQHDSETGRSADSAWRSILAQVLHRHRDNKELLYRCIFMMNDKAGGQLIASPAVVKELLELCLPSDAIIVIDGVDECENYHGFIPWWLTVTRRCPGVRILFLSRVTAARLKSAVPPELQLSVSKESISNDIRMFLEAEIHELFRHDILPRSAQPCTGSLVNHLVKGADGMFLWARLMIKFLQSPCMTRDQRLDIITEINVPEGLEGIYKRIFRLIYNSGSTARALATMSLRWITHAIIPLSSRQLQQALTVDGYIKSVRAGETISEFEDTVIVACAGLVERRRESLRLSHLSVEEFLKDSGRVYGSIPTSPADSLILSDPIAINLNLSCCCLRQLLFHTPANPLSGHLTDRVSTAVLEQDFPFTDYAAVCWLIHLQLCKARDRMLIVVDTFLTKDILPSLPNFASSLSTFLSSPRTASVWLESFYTAKPHEHQVSIGIYDIFDNPPLQFLHEWVDWAEDLRTNGSQAVSNDFLRTVQHFVADTGKIIDKWGRHLRTSPQTVWDEMTGFIPSPFFFSPGSVKVSILKPQAPESRMPTGAHLMHISCTSKHGLKAVLSVWPNGLFQNDRYMSRIQSSRESDLLELCEGWVACYEVWPLHAGGSRIANIRIELDPQEVVLSVRSYLDPASSHQIKIPCSIRSDVMAFTVLRTLFVLTSSSTSVECVSQRVPQSSIPDPGFLFQRGRLWRYSFDISMSPNGRYFAVWENNEISEQNLSVFEYTAGRALRMAFVGEVKFPRSPKVICHISYHPTLAILAFCRTPSPGSFWHEYEKDEERVVIWQFRKQNNGRYYILGVPVDFDAKDIYFSSCGSFLVTKSINDEVSVVPVAKEMLKDPSSEIPERLIQEQQVDGELEFCQQGQLTTDLAMIEVLGNPDGASMELTGLSRDNAAVPISVVASGRHVQLSVETASGVEMAKILNTPDMLQSYRNNQQLSIYRGGEYTWAISVDQTPRRLYPTISGMDGGLEVPTVIERDTRYISLSRPIRTVVDPLGVYGLIDEVNPAQKRVSERSEFEPEAKRRDMR